MTSTGKKARKRYGNRFAAKQRKDSGTSTSRRSRKRFGKLAYSCEAKNVPEGAVRANDDLLERVGRERAQNGWDQDANVMVPGPTRASVDARIRAEEQAQKDAEKAVRRAAKKAQNKGGK
jgi:hypothetical protein